MVTTRLASKAIRESGNGSPSPQSLGTNFAGEVYQSPGDHDVKQGHSTKKRRVARSKDMTAANSRINMKATGVSGSGKKRLMVTSLQTLPLEIVFEIFSLLHPLDLTHLSRLNKALRNVLMSKSSANIWISARSNMERSPPECPPDQSEPQWAKLLFEMSCTICNTPRIKIVEWTLRLRACQPCFKANLISHNRALTVYSHLGNIKEILELLNFIVHGGPWQMSITKHRVYYIDSILKMAELVEGFRCQVDARIPGAEDRLEAFKLSREAGVSKVIESASALFDWASKQENMRAESRAILVKARRQALSERLLTLGHNEKDVDQAVLRVYGTAQLTDKSWEAARPKIEVAVEENKIKRLAQERKEYIVRRHRHFFTTYQNFLKIPGYEPPFPGFAPCSFDVLEQSPSMRELVEAEGYPLLLQTMMAQLPDVLNDWRRKQKKTLLALIPQDTLVALALDAELGERFEVFNLAKCVFQCELTPVRPGNSPPLFLEASLTQHKCWYRRSSSECCITPSDDDEFNEFTCLEFAVSASDCVDTLCKAVHLDPSTTSVITLDTVDARFECTECPESQPKIRNWRRAITHKHSDGGQPCFQRVPSGWENVTKALELGRKPPNMVCRICNKRLAFKGLAHHLEQVHGKSPAIDNVMIDPSHPAEPIHIVQVEERLLEIGSSETWNLPIHPENTPN